MNFFKKYNVPESIVKKCPSNLEILTKKIPIYTNSSTIVLETLCYGYNLFSLAQDTIVSLVLKLSLKMSGKIFEPKNLKIFIKLKMNK